MKSHIQTDTFRALSGEPATTETKKIRAELADTQERLSKMEHRLDEHEAQQTSSTEKKPFWSTFGHFVTKALNAIVGFILIAPKIINGIIYVRDRYKISVAG